MKRNDPWSHELQKVKSKLKDQGFYSSPDLTGGFDAGTEDAVIYFQQTHLGPDGSPLDITGEIDSDTRWALNHPTGKSQKSFLMPSVPRGIDEMRKVILSVALEEHKRGVRERPNGSNRSKDIDKYFPTWLKNKLEGASTKGPAWCAYFVNWVVSQCMARPWGGYIGSCSKLVEACKKKGLHVYTSQEVMSEGAIIRPGDLFFILHPKKPGKPRTGHVGFVLRVNRSGRKINTLEGNCGNRVKCGLRDVGTLNVFVNFANTFETDFARTLVPADSVAKAGTR